MARIIDVLKDYLGSRDSYPFEKLYQNTKKQKCNSRLFLNTIYITNEESSKLSNFTSIGNKILKLIKELKPKWLLFRIAPNEELLNGIFAILYSFIYFMQSNDAVDDKHTQEYIKHGFLYELFQIQNQREENVFDTWASEYTNFFIPLKAENGEFYIFVEPLWYEFYKTYSTYYMSGYMGCLAHPILARQYKFSNMPIVYYPCKEEMKPNKRIVPTLVPMDTVQMDDPFKIDTNFSEMIDNNGNSSRNSATTTIMIDPHNLYYQKYSVNNIMTILSRIKKYFSISWFVSTLYGGNYEYKTLHRKVGNYKNQTRLLLDPFKSSIQDWNHYNFLFSYIPNINPYQIFTIINSFYLSNRDVNHIVIKKKDQNDRTPTPPPSFTREKQQMINVIGFFFSATYINAPHCIKGDLCQELYNDFFPAIDDNALEQFMDDDAYQLDSKSLEKRMSIFDRSKKLISRYPMVAKTLYLLFLKERKTVSPAEQFASYISISKPTKSILKAIISDNKLNAQREIEHDQGDSGLYIATTILNDKAWLEPTIPPSPVLLWGKKITLHVGFDDFFDTEDDNGNEWIPKRLSCSSSDDDDDDGSNVDPSYNSFNSDCKWTKNHTKLDIIDEDLITFKKSKMVLSLYQMCRDQIINGFNLFTKEQILNLIFAIKLYDGGASELVGNDSGGGGEGEKKRKSSKKKANGIGLDATIELLEKYRLMTHFKYYEEMVRENHYNNEKVYQDRKEGYINFFKKCPDMTEEQYKGYLSFVYSNNNCNNISSENEVKNNNSHIWLSAVEILANATNSSKNQKSGGEYIDDKLSACLFGISSETKMYHAYNSFIINPEEFISKKVKSSEDVSQVVNSNVRVITPVKLVKDDGKSNIGSSSSSTNVVNHGDSKLSTITTTTTTTTNNTMGSHQQLGSKPREKLATSSEERAILLNTLNSKERSELPHSYIINTKEVINNKKITRHQKGSKSKKTKVPDFEVQGQKAIWDNDSIMIIKSQPVPDIDLLNSSQSNKSVVRSLADHKYTIYEQKLYDKLSET